jgi:hypothetical protein
MFLSREALPCRAFRDQHASLAVLGLTNVALSCARAVPISTRKAFAETYLKCQLFFGAIMYPADIESFDGVRRLVFMKKTFFVEILNVEKPEPTQ